MPKHITSVYWSTQSANVGETVDLTANLSGFEDGDSVTFVVEEYSGIVQDTITTLTASASGGQATARWTVQAVEENFPGRGLPEYRFRAKLYSSQAGVASKLLKIGDVQSVTWIDSVTGSARATQANRTQAYFKNDEEVKLEIRATGLKGFTVDVEIFMDNELGKSTRWSSIKKINGVAFANGIATTTFKVPKTKYKEWGFANFRAKIKVKHSGKEYKPTKYQTGYARHYTQVLGFFGAGPSKEGWSNSTLIDMAEEAGGMVFYRTYGMVRRLSKQIAPEETNLRIFGYSRGGLTVAYFSRLLQKRNINVKLAVGMDPIKIFGDTVKLPDNVQQAKCYRQDVGFGQILGWVLKKSAEKGDKYVRNNGTETNITNVLLPNPMQAPNGTMQIPYHELIPVLLKEQVLNDLR